MKDDCDQRRDPPKPTGTVLVDVPCRRAIERGGPQFDGVLRVTVDEFNGNKYVGVRFWRADSDGSLWPTRLALTLRPRELPAILEALQRAAAELQTEKPPQERTWLDEQRERQRPRTGGPSVAAAVTRGEEGRHRG